MIANTPRSFDLNSAPHCPGISLYAQAYSLNITAAGTQGPGFIVIYPQGEAVPVVSTLNYVGGQTIANAAIVPAGISGGVTVIAGTSGTHLIIDINGYYAPAGVGAFNTFLGLNAGNFTMTGDNNTAIGNAALASNTSGGLNTATGTGALQHNTTSFSNTATGAGALYSNTTGNDNTATGANALFNNTEGFRNIAVGGFALRYNTTGSRNVALGYSAGTAIVTGNDNIDIANAGFNDESGQIRIGTAGVHTGAVIQGIYGGAIDGLGVVINAGGRLGTTPSSRRFKENVRDIDAESDALMSLRPVAFQYKREIDPSGLAQYGLIAEEVAEIFPELVVYDADGRPETIRYQLLDPLLLNEVQKQHRIAEAHEKAIEQQKETIDRQNIEIEGLKDRLSRLEARLRVQPQP